MSRSVRLSDELFEDARKRAKIFHRSPPQQIEHWAHIGRVMEAALSFPVLEKAAWGGREDIDKLIVEVDSAAGKRRARRAIRDTSKEPYGADRDRPVAVARNS